MSPRDRTREFARGDEPLVPSDVHLVRVHRQTPIVVEPRVCSRLYYCTRTVYGTRTIIYRCANLISITYERARARVDKTRRIDFFRIFLFRFSSPGRTANYHIIVSYTVHALSRITGVPSSMRLTKLRDKTIVFAIDPRLLQCRDAEKSRARGRGKQRCACSTAADRHDCRTAISSAAPTRFRVLPSDSRDVHEGGGGRREQWPHQQRSGERVSMTHRLGVKTEFFRSDGPLGEETNQVQ